MSKYYLAIDIGASSGRHIIGWLEDGRMKLKEIHRFENRQREENGHLVWDIDNLWKGIIDGLKACKTENMIPETVGIDTWGVDYVLLDKEGNMVGDAVAYRDNRTVDMDKALSKFISEKELYQRTGIQKQPFNTIYQLLALKKESPEQLEEAESLLMIPDYFNFRLTGVRKQEYTNATTSNLVNASDKEWDLEIIDKLGLPKKLFGKLSVPGTVVGDFCDEIAEEAGFKSTVILPATHDTGSAFLSVPARDESSVYLSSGTWSLLGVENPSPITSDIAQKENLTNEGGAFYRYRFLKNIMGLWIIQSIRRELNGSEYVEGRKSKYATGKTYSFPDLIEEARKCNGFETVLDVNDSSFLSPESMIDAIKENCQANGQKVPESVGEIMQCVYSGLSKCYADTIKEIEDITGKKITGINIIGGGCQDNYLNELTAKATGLPVFAGPIEGTAIGNLVIQMITGGLFEDLQTARNCIFESFDIKTFNE
ncbi:rhamnulokinase [Butyrivibrio sp. CB08]|uniref:rhamnulokinase n=1 Tax=Butyrivibrio sp. CB08 TaxID=2364879 RepID=UPI000EA9EF70|nr:rhamnulokinase [Butyrivibrio sp. CB08]RKM59746.1 rhamnulokinase [Butyrivibrio sp. CB08]